MLGNFVLESLSSDFKIDLATSFLDPVSDLFNLTEDCAEKPELAAFSLVEWRFAPPAG